MAVDGDLRFISHHDTLRAMERITARAGLPMHFSRGFNPRPSLSLTLPRPVGIAGADERLVIELEESPAEASALLSALSEQAPRGMTFLDARELNAGESLRPARAEYEYLAADEPDEGELARRVESLPAGANWPIERRAKKQPRRRRPDEPPRTRTLNIRPMVERIAAEPPGLGFTLVPHNQAWAKPAEVLALLGLNEQYHVARLRRVRIDDGFAPDDNTEPR